MKYLLLSLSFIICIGLTIQAQKKSDESVLKVTSSEELKNDYFTMGYYQKYHPNDQYPWLGYIKAPEVKNLVVGGFKVPDNNTWYPPQQMKPDNRKRDRNFAISVTFQVWPYFKGPKVRSYRPTFR